MMNHSMNYRKRLSSSYIIMITDPEYSAKGKRVPGESRQRSSPIESPLVILPKKFSSYITPAVINIIFLYYLESPTRYSTSIIPFSQYFLTCSIYDSSTLSIITTTSTRPSRHLDSFLSSYNYRTSTHMFY